MSAHSPGAWRLVAPLLAHSAVTQVVTFVLRPTVSYRAIELGVPAAWLGAMTASFAIVPLFLAVPSGQAADRLGERRVLLGGAVMMVLSTGLFLLPVLGTTGLVLGTAVLGTGQLCCVVAQQAAVANTAGPGTFDTAFGHYAFAASLGQAAGPGLISLAGGSRAIPDTTVLFVIAAGLAILLIPLGVLLPLPPQPRQRGPAAARSTRGLLRLPGLPRALAVSCVIVAALDITVVYLPALGTDRHLPAAFVGLLLTLRAVASMASRVFLGRVVAKAGRRRLIVTSVGLSALAMAAIALPMSAIALSVLVAILGLGLGVGQPLTMSWLAEVAPAGLRGRAMSLRLTGNRLGQVVVPSAVGAVAAGVGAPGVLGATAAALAVVAAAARRLTLDNGEGPGHGKPTPADVPT